MPRGINCQLKEMHKTMTNEQYKQYITKMLDSLDNKDLSTAFEIVQRLYLTSTSTSKGNAA